MEVQKTVKKDSAHKDFLQITTTRKLLSLNIILAIVYFLALVFFFQKGNTLLFGILVFGEIFHLFQIVGYVASIWDTKPLHAFDSTYTPEVDVFIPVAGEPVEIVEETVRAAQSMKYANKVHIYILNDSYVAKKENWQEYEELAKKLNVQCVTRNVPGGFKAGNINNGLRIAKSPFIAVFDSDHVPHHDFLQKMMGYFCDYSVAFVQSPQYYKNQDVNLIASTAWDQQSIFFGPILQGKNTSNSVFMCGTNMILRRSALEDAGGMCEFNIAEDFLTSLFIHEKGWKSIYVPEVLAEGYAPEDFLSYYKQQFRWTRGSLEVIFKFNPLFRKGLSLKQKFQYLVSASYYFSGVIVLINAMLPLLFLFFNISPIESTTMTLAGIFIPYILLNLYVLQASGNFSYSYKALAFSMSSFWIHLTAIWAVVSDQKTAFAVTSKQQLEGNFLHLVIPQLTYIVIAIAGITYAVFQDGWSASVVTNATWALLYIVVFIPFIYAAFPLYIFKDLNKKLIARLQFGDSLAVLHKHGR